MPTVERLCLEEALEDAPQMRSLLRLFEEDTNHWKDFTSEYQASCQRLCNAQMEVYEATKNLSVMVRKVETKNFPVSRDTAQFKSSMNQFSAFLNEFSLVQRSMANHISEGFMKPLNRLINKDLQVLTGLSNRHQVVREEADQATQTYLRLSTRASPEALTEAADDLAQMRRKRHTTALQYYGGLNVLQYRFRQAVLSSVSTGLAGWRRASRELVEPMRRPELEEFIRVTDTTTVELTQGLDHEREKCEQLARAMREHHVSLYSPLVSERLSPACFTLGYKAGYLAQKVRGGGLLQQTRWLLAYFFTQAGNLMVQPKDELAGSLLVDLNEEGVAIETIEAEDRRNLFQISVPSKLPQKRPTTFVLQADSDKERQEWVATIINVIREGGYVKRTPCSSTAGGESSLDDGGVHASLQSWLAAQPIQFDLETSLLPGTHLNPFNAPHANDSDASWIRDAPADDTQEAEEHSSVGSSIGAPPRVIDSFQMRFIGCVRVPDPTGEEQVSAVLRHIMGARAAHNMFRMIDVTCDVRSDGLSILDSTSGGPRVVMLPIDRVTFWCSHRENSRMFGVITGPVEESPLKGSTRLHSYLCHAFECDDGHAISRAIRCAVKLTDPKKNEETALLLANIDQLPDLAIGESSQPHSPQPNHSDSSSPVHTLSDDINRISTA